MKKTMVSLLAMSALAVSLLAGCAGTGENRDSTTEPPRQTGVLPDLEDMVPDVAEPDPRDGEVTDTDGIITQNDDARSAERDDGLADGHETDTAITQDR